MIPPTASPVAAATRGVPVPGAPVQPRMAGGAPAAVPPQQHPMVRIGQAAALACGQFVQASSKVENVDQGKLQKGAAMLREGIMTVMSALPGTPGHGGAAAAPPAPAAPAA